MPSAPRVGPRGRSSHIAACAPGSAPTNGRNAGPRAYTALALQGAQPAVAGQAALQRQARPGAGLIGSDRCWCCFLVLLVYCWYCWCASAQLGRVSNPPGGAKAHGTGGAR